MQTSSLLPSQPATSLAQHIQPATPPAPQIRPRLRPCPECLAPGTVIGHRSGGGFADSHTLVACSNPECGNEWLEQGAEEAMGTLRAMTRQRFPW